MPNSVLLTFLGLDFVFLLSGGLMIATSVIFAPGGSNMMSSNVATNMLLQHTPLMPAIANAGLVFLAFFLSLPAFLMPKNRVCLHLHKYVVILCATFSLVIGLDIWYSTLQTRANLGRLWALQTPQMQSSLQQEFSCCGYLNSTSPQFTTDKFCSNPTVAAAQPGCVTPFAAFANNLLDIVFTAVFGVVALDVLLFLSAVVVLKDRAQTERYRLIDEKSGFGGI